jgi:hypothetical protein
VTIHPHVRSSRQVSSSAAAQRRTSPQLPSPPPFPPPSAPATAVPPRARSLGCRPYVEIPSECQVQGEAPDGGGGQGPLARLPFTAPGRRQHIRRCCIRRVGDWGGSRSDPLLPLPTTMCWKATIHLLPAWTPP